MNIKNEKILIFDGACGTNIQRMNLPLEAWSDYLGCNEFLNISRPDAVVALHKSFLDAGATVIETNTFGATSIVLAEYGLENQVEKINRAAVEHARTAINGQAGRYIAASIGPGTKLPSLGHISTDEMCSGYADQMQILMEAGVDLIMVETSQDLLQLKMVVIAAIELNKKLGLDIPVAASVTIELSGTTLVGADIATIIASLEPLPLFSLGLNCATGPDTMAPQVAYLSKNWAGRISVSPNAGIPEIKDGETTFPLSPEQFADAQRAFVENEGVSIVGGCCGTTPEHIEHLAKTLDGISPARRKTNYPPSLASLYNCVEIAQEIPPLLVGERMNSTGSKKFRKLLINDDFEGAVQIGRNQQAQGAHVLDLSVAYAGRDELSDIREMVRRLTVDIRRPLVIDSTNCDAIEAALEIYPGRALVNSVNLEDGGKNLDKVCKTVKKHGAAVVALAIGPEGMAKTTEDKIKVADELHRLAVDKYGLRPSDIFFDLLTFTICSGDLELKDAAIQTLDAIKQLKKKYPKSFTILGISNISFGLPPGTRKVLNSMFLHEAIEAGLDAAIVDAAKILPLNKISDNERKLCLDLIYNRQDGQISPLDSIIEHFRDRKEKPKESDTESVAPEKQIEFKVIDGEREGMEDLISILLEGYSPLDIINQLLVPSMRRVGDLFGRGEMLLPFVLKSAEVMKYSVDILEPLMTSEDTQERLKVLLATVQGDVHDIGKNLVDIILSNNGYKVFNIGINMPTETIIKKAKELKVDAVGLSGLLVKSAMAMKDSLPLFEQAGLNVPVFLGGAALTPRFVAESCVPNYTAPVVYCSDAFSGLAAMQSLESGNLKSTIHLAGKPLKKHSNVELKQLPRNNPVPSAPFFGKRDQTDILPTNLIPLLNKQSLFRGRWGFRKGKLSADEYAKLISEKAQPLLDRLLTRIVDENLINPKVAYGYFKCFAENDSIIINSAKENHVLSFPRQSFTPGLCIADYIKDESLGGDVIGLFVVTLGDKMATETQRLFKEDAFHDYMMLHGLGTELTEALAELWHRQMRSELKISTGMRYGFGYPSCPNLDAHKTIFELLDPSTLGVALTETMEMVPELSTSGIFIHHPGARYFSI